MATWSKLDLHNIVETDDLHVAPLRSDGKTFGTPTWIWCVAVDDQLYVRAYNGTASRWFQAAKAQGAGQIQAANREVPVHFEQMTGPINDRIDEAYRQKYSGSPYLADMISKRSRDATMIIVPAS